MEEKNEMKQAISDVQHLKELRQRINEKAESLIMLRINSRQEWLWLVVAILIVLVAEVINYFWDDFWAFNGWFIGFIIGSSVMYILMRYFLSKMKKASNAPQQYRAAKRFIKTSQLSLWISLAVAFLVKDIAKTHGTDIGESLFAICFITVIGIIWISVRHQSFIDRDFYNDVEELGEYK